MRDEGQFKIGVTIDDVGGSTTSATSSADIADAALTASGTTVSATKGVAISGATVATFADANPNATASDFTATIDWGDGTSTRGTVVAQSGGGFAVDGAHTYANGGQFNTGVTIDDVGGSTASATSTATVKTTVTAAEAIANYQGNPNIAPQLVVDTAANVVANLDGLETLASANDVVSISLTDNSAPTLTITATQLANDALALEQIITPFTITATGTIGAAAAASIPTTLAAKLTSGLVVADTEANVTPDLIGLYSALNQLAISNELASIIVTDTGSITIAAHPFGSIELITTKLLDALLNGGTTVILGDGARTFNRPNAEVVNTGETIDFASSAFQNFHLNGGVISGGTIITGPGGIINSPGGSDAGLANSLDGVTISGGLTLEPGNSLELLGDTISGAVTVSSSSYLFLDGGNFTFENLTLNGGNVDAGAQLISGLVTIPTDGLVHGYGEFAPFFHFLENEGAINSDVNGQLLAINVRSFTNDSLVEASNGGKMEVAGAVTGNGQFLIAKAATLELGGPTAETVTFESGGAGTLYLDKATEFSGAVAGLAQGDAIDLADFAFSAHPVITNVTGTGAAGSTTEVIITDGSLSTTLRLLNQYDNEYPIASTAYYLQSDHSGSPNAGHCLGRW